MEALEASSSDEDDASEGQGNHSQEDEDGEGRYSTENKYDETIDSNMSSDDDSGVGD